MSDWISVEDRLPESGGIYLVSFRNHGVWFGHFHGRKWLDTDQREFGMTEFGDDLTVTHWQPLPSPPK